MQKRFVLLIVTVMAVFVAATLPAQAQTISNNGIDFTLKECRYAGGLVTCYLTIISHGKDRHVEQASSFSGPVFTLTDNLANTYPLKDVRVANKDRFDTVLIADLPTPLQVSSEFPSNADNIDSLDMYIETEGLVPRYRFRNIQVIRDGPQPVSNKPTAVYNGVTFVFDACRVHAGTLICTFSVVSTNKDSRIDEGYCIGCRDPQGFVDNLANQYSIDELIYGGNTPTKTLFANAKTPLRISTSGFNADATSLAMLEFRFQDTFMWFRNLPIEVGPPYVSPKNNVALNKPVRTQTNGGVSRSCASAQGITDGKLTGGGDVCSSRSVMGFQKNDYNRLMEVTVSIDLGKKYRITAIRYNPGNVERAETWNADVMSSPFGRSSTNPGTPGEGAWTEQKGDVTTSSVEIKFQKTRRSYPTDWLTIGEIEVIGTPVAEPEVPNGRVPADSPNAQLVAKIRDALDRGGWRRVVVEATPRDIVVRGEVLDGDIPKILTLVSSFRPAAMRNELTACPTVKGRCIRRPL